jgi:hypothetical protein
MGGSTIVSSSWGCLYRHDKERTGGDLYALGAGVRV